MASQDTQEQLPFRKEQDSKNMARPSGSYSDRVKIVEIERNAV